MNDSITNSESNKEITSLKDTKTIFSNEFSIYENEQEEFNIYKDETDFFDDYNQLFDIEFSFY